MSRQSLIDKAAGGPSTAPEVERGKLHKDQGIASAVPEPFEDQVDTSPHGFCKAVDRVKSVSIQKHSTPRTLPPPPKKNPNKKEQSK